jgi:4-amino-4-deoxy-L-arabinose transferase-like glycosyltransferase
VNDTLTQLRIETLKNDDLKYILLLAALAVVMLFWHLGGLPFVGPDEPRYAEVAREMYLSGDWITPRLGGITWFEKPPLLYWMAALGFQLFGVSEFAARFGTALTGALGAYCLYFFGRRVRSARFGYLSASTLLTTGVWVGFGRAASFDMVLAVTLEAALIAFYLWVSEPPLTGAWWILCLLTGVAVLAKGLAGLALPAMIIVIFLAVTGELRRLFESPLRLALGAVLFLAICAVWYGPMISRHGSSFIHEFFIAHHFQRFLTNKYHHPQPFYFFFLVALLGCFPWTPYLPTAIRSPRRLLERSVEARLRLFLWIWTLVPVVFFSFSGSKLPGYILPAFPAIALLIGLELDRLWTDPSPARDRWLSAATGGLLLIVALAVGLVAQNELPIGKGAAWSTAAIAGGVAVIHLILLLTKSARTATLWLPFGLVIVVIAATHWMYPAIATRESLRELSELALAKSMPGERLAFYINSDQGVNFYAGGLPLRDARSELEVAMKPEEIEGIIKKEGTGSLLVMTPGRWSRDLFDSPRLAVEQLGERVGQPKCSPECDIVLLRVRRT